MAVTVLESARIVAAAADMARAPLPADDGYAPGLAMLCDGVNGCALATPEGRASIERQAIGHLANRFAIEAWLAEHPALVQAPVERPVFVLGMPRTGTTLMVNLLGQDPAARTLRKWEANIPVPPAAPGMLSDDPRCIRLNAVRRAEVASGKLQTNIHFEWYEEPTECVFVLAQDFRSTLWDAFLPMPGYSDFLLGGDMQGAYRWHRRVLQHLQANNGGRWTLKAPGHALFARDLLRVYPDARIVWMHRDPATVVASHASLAAGAHRRFAAQADVAYIADLYPRQLAAHVDRMLDVEAAFPDQVFHVRYEDVEHRPVETVERLHAEMGVAFTSDIARSVAAWVAAHPRGARGAHDYSLAQYGIEPARVDRLFARYRERLAAIEPLSTGENA